MRHQDASSSRAKAAQSGPTSPPLALRHPGATKELALQSLVEVTPSASAAMPTRPLPPVFRLSWIVERATPQTSPDLARAHPIMGEAAISVAIVACSVPALPASRSLSSIIDGSGVPQLLNRGEQTLTAVTGSGGRLHFGMVAQESNRNGGRHQIGNPRPDCVGIRSSPFIPAPGRCSCVISPASENRRWSSRAQ